MSRRLPLGLPVVLMAVVVALAARGARARGTLDQSNTAPTSDGETLFLGDPTAWGQTFTAGLSGALDTVALDLQTSSASVTITVGIYATDGSGLPNPAALLASAMTTVTQTSVPTDPSQYTVVTFPTPAAVVAGRVYALVLSNLTGGEATVTWFWESPSAYPRGQAVVASTIAGPYEGDTETGFDFQTFVTLPTPTPSPSPSPTSTATPSPTPVPAIVVLSPEFTLATTGCGTTSPPPGPVFVNGLQNVVVTAQPCPGSRFVGWTNGPCAGTTITPCDIAPTSGVITANFTP